MSKSLLGVVAGFRVFTLEDPSITRLAPQIDDPFPAIWRAARSGHFSPAEGDAAPTGARARTALKSPRRGRTRVGRGGNDGTRGYLLAADVFQLRNQRFGLRTRL